MVFWLLVSFVSGAATHVGNFPDLQSCQAAGKSVWLYQSNGVGSGYEAICVKADTGKPGDPSAPP
jgi:hypothetical protein